MNCINGYTVVAYQESMPQDWQMKLDLLPFGYLYAIHDKDIYTDGQNAGELKKTHLHFCFQGKATKKQKQYIHEALGVKYGQDIRNFSAFYDYLTHENHKNKYHYDKSVIKQSFKWEQELFDAQYKPKIDYTTQLIQFIDKNNIVEYSELFGAILGEFGADEEILKVAKQYWVIRYIDSKRNILKN